MLEIDDEIENGEFTIRITSLSPLLAEVVWVSDKWKQTFEEIENGLTLTFRPANVFSCAHRDQWLVQEPADFPAYVLDPIAKTFDPFDVIN